MSKIKKFKEQFLNVDGKSEMIERYKLPEPFAYTSGDGIFRSDGILGKGYKFVRFHKNWNPEHKSKLSCCWRYNISSDELDLLKEDFRNLTFPLKAGVSVHFIKFYGLSQNPICDQGIRLDIRNYIISLPCVVCRRTDGIECDHKNDLYKMNEPRLLRKDEQKLDDFQPLCKHCNDKKRSENSVKIKNIFEKTGKWKRQPSPYPNAKFLPNTGGEYFDHQNPKWYIGTYWGDVAEFNRHLTFN